MNYTTEILNSANWLPITIFCIGVVSILIVVSVIIIGKISKSLHTKHLSDKFSLVWLKAVWYIPIVILLIFGTLLTSTFDQTPASSEKLNYLLENTDSYLVGDYSNGCYMEIPSYIEELPININVYSLDLEPIGTVNVEKWEDMPISLDDLWYCYGTQEQKDLFLQTSDNPLTYGMTFVYRPELNTSDDDGNIESKKSLQSVYTICFPETKGDIRPWIGFIIIFCCCLLAIYRICEDLLYMRKLRKALLK